MRQRISLSRTVRSVLRSITGINRFRVKSFGQSHKGEQIFSREEDPQVGNTNFTSNLGRYGISYLQILQPYIGSILKIAGLRLLIFSKIVNQYTREIGILVSAPEIITFLAEEIKMRSKASRLSDTPCGSPKHIVVQPGITFRHSLKE